MSHRFDREDQVSDNQVYPAAATVSTDSLKKPASQDLSFGSKLTLGVFLTAALTGTPTSVLVEAIQADDAALTSNVQVMASRTFLAAELFLNQGQEIPVPIGKQSKAFIGARVTITGGTTPTATFSMYYGEEGQFSAPYKSFPKVVDAQVS